MPLDNPASQAFSNIAVTGGAINGTPIGATTPGTIVGTTGLFKDVSVANKNISLDPVNGKLIIRRDVYSGSETANLSLQNLGGGGGTVSIEALVRQSNSSPMAKIVFADSGGGGANILFYASIGAGTQRLAINGDGTVVTPSQLKITSVIASATTATGALIVTGGAGISGSLYAGAIAVGTGTPLLKMLSAIATLDFPSIAADSSADLTVTVTGAAVNDLVQLGLPASPASGINFKVFVSSANTITVRAQNDTGMAIDPASASYRVSVMGF